jgi:effector-binding domain-containing protein
MKALKFLAKAIAVLGLLYLILCSFGPQNMNVSKSVMIGASPESVFEEVADFQKNNSWSPWYKKDMGMKQQITGAPAQAGHKQEWESTEVGSGSQEITECIPPRSIKTVLKFKDWDGQSSASWSFEPMGDSTKTVWSMEGSDFPFFARGLMLLMGMRSQLEEEYTEGLKGLKQVVESKPSKSKPSFTMETTTEDLHYIAKRFVKHESELTPQLFSATFKELQTHAGAENIAGPPMSINHSFDLKTRVADVEIAIPVKAGTATLPGGTSGIIPAGMVVKAEHIGPYEEVAQIWPGMIQSILPKYNLRYSGYEVYVNDPEEVKDPSKYITWLMLPVGSKGDRE